MKSMSVLAAIALSFGLVACGGSGGGDDDDGVVIDAPAVVDAPVSIDAPAAMGIGQACTGMGQGDCPSGFQCLTLTGGSGSWCSKTCTAGTGDMCATGYTGPGRAQCILQITPQGGGTPQTFCGVVCMDAPGGADYCPGCTGACPGALACTSALMGGQPPMTLAMGCI